MRTRRRRWVRRMGVSSLDAFHRMAEYSSSSFKEPWSARSKALVELQATVLV